MGKPGIDVAIACGYEVASAEEGKNSNLSRHCHADCCAQLFGMPAV